MPNRNSNKLTSQSIIFLHIPKAAGTTLHRIIEKQYDPTQVVSFGTDAHESVKEFKRLPPSRKSEIQVVKGHMGFGLHQSLLQPSTYITILREPVERVISYYHHILRNPTHYLYEAVALNRLSLREVISGQMTPDLDNGQVRLLSGVWNTVPWGNCTVETLERAKRNLRDRVQVVGLAERFDETLLLLKRAFKWRMPFYVRANVTPNRPGKESFSQSALDAIKECNELDFALYSYAQALFEAQVCEKGLSLALELPLFRLLNRVYGITHSVQKSSMLGLRRRSRR